MALYKNQHRVPNFLLAAFILFLVSTAFYWMETNTAPPSWDQSWYLETSERLLIALRQQGLPAFLDSLMHAMSGIKAPLISLLPFPFYLTIGHGKLAVELTLLVVIVLFCLLFFRLARVMAGPWEALAAVVITNTMPSTYGLSRQFLVEYGLMTLITAWILLLIYSHGYRLMRYNIGLGIVLGLGLLMKVNFPLYIVGPAVFALYRRWREEGFNVMAWSRDLGVIGSAGVLICSIWYLPNLTNVLGFAYSASVGTLSLDYANVKVDPVSAAAVLEYWRVIINVVFSTYYALVLAVILLFFFILTVLKKRMYVASNSPIRYNGWIYLLLWFALPSFVLMLSINKDIRYILPVVPAIGLMLSFLLFRVMPWPRIRLVLLPLALTFPIASLCYTTFPVSPAFYVADQNWVLWSNNLGYATRPVQDSWPHFEIIETIFIDAKKHEPFAWATHEPQTLLIVDHPFFNLNNFSYYSAYLNMPLIFSAVLTRSEAEWPDRRDYLLQSEYALTKESGDQGPTFTTFMNAKIRQMLADGTLPFVRVAQFALPDGSESILYRNTQLTGP